MGCLVFGSSQEGKTHSGEPGVEVFGNLEVPYVLPKRAQEFGGSKTKK